MVHFVIANQFVIIVNHNDTTRVCFVFGLVLEVAVGYFIVLAASDAGKLWWLGKITKRWV